VLAKSDRLRILCLALDLSFDDFLAIFAGARDPQKLRDQVRAWWEHRQQPLKEAGRLVQLLSSVGSQKSINLNVSELWRAEITPSEFANACNLSSRSVAAVVSDVCRRGMLEPIDSIPHLKLFNARYIERPETVDQALRNQKGTYFVYRIHSSERSLCQETVVIYPEPANFYWSARYIQYAEGHRKREINLSLFPTERWTHALGSYTDRMTNGTSRSSMLHAILVNAPYRRSTFTGLLLDVVDNETSTAAQRILLRKVSDKVISDLDRHVAVQRETTVRMQRIREFLRIGDQDEQFMLTADQARITRMLEGGRHRA